MSATYPHSLEFEYALLGGAIAHAAPHVLPAPEDFYRPEHAAVAALILRMAGLGEPINGITVSERIHRTGTPDRFGGVLEVLRLEDVWAPPGASALSYYARMVSDFARRRRALRRLEEIGETLRTADRAEDVLTAEVVAAVALLDGGGAAAVLRALGYAGDRERCAGLFRELMAGAGVPEAANGPARAAGVAVAK